MDFLRRVFRNFLIISYKLWQKKLLRTSKTLTTFIQKISELGEIPNDALLCTIDVVGLYPSILHDKGLEALKAALEHRKDKSISADSLMELARIVLKNNFFELDGEFYLQLRGTAIGRKCAPSYTILSMAALEEKLLSQAPDRPWLWWRYINDIFLIWHHGE